MKRLHVVFIALMYMCVRRKRPYKPLVKSNTGMHCL
jgi:hypothetical protein